MKYNTTRDPLVLPEYGRNVQRMIKYAISIEDRSERNKAASAIIELMGQLNPHLRDVEDFRHKLWTHLFLMSDFKLDVDSPYEIPKIESLQEKPKQVEYPKSKIKYGHYGKYTASILNKSKDLNDEEKEFITKTMGNFMKKQYLMHNNDTVDNNVISENLNELSEGNLKMENPDEDLVSTSSLLKTLGINNNQKRNNKNYHKHKTKHKRN